MSFMPSKLLLISLACGLVAFVALRLHIDRLEARVTGGAMTRVLMLTSDLGAGARVTREVVASRELPEAYRESRHIPASKLEQVLGAQLAVGARANETLLWSDLTSVRPEARKLSSLIPPGLRAMTLQARGNGFDALLTPGDRIDVLRPGAAAGTEVVMQDVVVLAVGYDLGGPQMNGPQGRPETRDSTVTVSVTLEQSRVLAQAELMGGLRLVMRNPDDIALGGTPRVGAP